MRVRPAAATVVASVLSRTGPAGAASLAAAVAALAVATPAFAASPVVVELFTSEGCSSCPPADAFLVDLARTRPDVLPLAFHVTYWNRLGWTDPFSLPAATALQDGYAALHDQSEVYTPEMIVDGGTGVVGSDRPAVLARIAAAERNPAPVEVGLAPAPGGVLVTVGAGTGQGRLVVVGYDDLHRTPVGGGENDGRTLMEANIVRGIVDGGAWTGGAVRRVVARPPGQRVAVLLQAPDGRILGAARAS